MTFISHFRSSSLPYNLHWLPAGIVPTPFILCYSSISVSYVYDFSVIYTHNPDILLNSYYYADTEVSLNTHLIAIIYTYYYIYVCCLLFLISIKHHSYIWIKHTYRKEHLLLWNKKARKPILSEYEQQKLTVRIFEWKLTL